MGEFPDPRGKVALFVRRFLRGPWAYIIIAMDMGAFRESSRLNKPLLLPFFALSWLLLSSESQEVDHGFLNREMQKTASCFYSGSCLHLFPSCNTTTSGTCHGAYHWNGTHVGLMVTDNPFLSSSSFSPDDHEVCLTDLHFSGIGEIMFSGPRGSPYLCQLSINDSMNRSFKELQDEPRKSGCKCHLSGEIPLQSDKVNHQHEWSLAVSGDKTCFVHVKGDEVSFGTKNLLDCLFPEMCLACSEYFPSHHDVNFKFHDFGDAARTLQLPTPIIFGVLVTSIVAHILIPIYPILPVFWYAPCASLCLLLHRIHSLCTSHSQTWRMFQA